MKILEYSVEEMGPTKLSVINSNFNFNFELSDKELIYQYLRYTDILNLTTKLSIRQGLMYIL